MLVRYDGRPAVALGVANVAGANVAKMGAAIDAKLARTAATRPIGIEVHEFYHQGKVVDEAVWSFVLNVIAALVIVLVTLQVFMGFRSAAVIGSVLLLTIAATLTAMYAVGIPMHRISLGALIIALGMLVDNAIVVTEGILAGTRQGAEEARRRPGDRRSHQMAAPRRHPRRDPRLRAHRARLRQHRRVTPAICSGWC